MKKILYLGPPCRIIQFLEDRSCIVTRTQAKLELADLKKSNPDHIISYGYRHIIKQDIIDAFDIINLHISYLPWNRGADPNFWSIFDNTPKGVTIHFIDRGIDTGNILFQKEVVFLESENTLSLTYQRLKNEIENLLIEKWDDFVNKSYKLTVQCKTEGTHHYKKNIEKYWKLLPQGWDSTIDDIESLSEQLSR